LDGFASRKRGKEHYVFVFGREKPFEPNTKGIAKRRLFYGEPSETGVEGALAKRETAYAAALRSLRSSRSPEPSDLAVAFEFIGQLMIRTAYLRDAMVDTTNDLLSRMARLMASPKSNAFYQRRIIENPRLMKRQVRAALARTPGITPNPLVRLALE